MNQVFMKNIACSFTALTAVLMLASGCAAQNNASKFGGFGSQQPTSQNAAGTLTSATNNSPGLLDPTKATDTAPAQFDVLCRTNKGVMTIRVHRDWAPNAADRFYNMVNVGFFNDIAIFRAIEGFMFQFGINGNPAVNAKWSEATIRDDPWAGQSNLRGRVTFAQTGAPNSRSTQMFINLRDNKELDKPRGGGSAFIPFGEIIGGHDVMDKINTKYGENGRDIQPGYKSRGDAFIRAKMPEATRIFSITLKPNN
ncbi:MAG: peptidylprolyl isomerase [Mariniblastus sp.]